LNGFHGSISRKCTQTGSIGNWDSISGSCIVDECFTNNGGCDLNAICKNTLGNYECICKEGYNGDGRICYKNRNWIGIGVGIIIALLTIILWKNVSSLSF